MHRLQVFACTEETKIQNSVYARLKAGRPLHEHHYEIVKLRTEGLSYDGISMLLSVHRSTVASICQKNKCAGRRNLKLNLEAVKKLRFEKRSYAAIARLFSVPMATVKSLCQRHGWGGKTKLNQWE